MVAWFLWVLASAVGGAVGGAFTFLEFIGLIFFWGLALGAAQALVFGRYLRDLTGGTGWVWAMWMSTSFVGWLGGWLVFVFVEISTIMTGVPEIALQAGTLVSQLTGFQGAASTLPLILVVGSVFAASQGAALALLLLALVLRDRSLLPLGILWALLGAVSTVPAEAAGYYVANVMGLGLSGGSSYTGQVLPLAVEQAAAGVVVWGGNRCGVRKGDW